MWIYKDNQWATIWKYLYCNLAGSSVIFNATIYSFPFFYYTYIIDENTSSKDSDKHGSNYYLYFSCLKTRTTGKKHLFILRPTTTKHARNLPHPWELWTILDPSSSVLDHIEPTVTASTMSSDPGTAGQWSGHTDRLLPQQLKTMPWKLNKINKFQLRCRTIRPLNSTPDSAVSPNISYLHGHSLQIMKKYVNFLKPATNDF